jgi:hypothetical protein
MRSLLQLFRVVNELIFVVVGLLLLWVALTGRFFFDPRQPSWLILAAVLILWGLYTWRRALRVAVPRVRLALKIGGASVMLVGLIMASLAWAPFAWAGLLLGAAGGIFVVRGLVSTAILARGF